MQTSPAIHPAGRLSRTLAGLAMAITLRGYASPSGDATIIAARDTHDQAAVERNDDATMAKILADDFVLVTGRGRVYTRAELLESAKKKTVIDEHQVKEAGTHSVSVWGEHGRGHCAAVDQGRVRWQVARIPTVVQRHLCAHAGGLALCFRPGVDPAPEGRGEVT